MKKIKLIIDLCLFCILSSCTNTSTEVTQERQAVRTDTIEVYLPTGELYEVKTITLYDDGETELDLIFKK